MLTSWPMWRLCQRQVTLFGWATPCEALPNGRPSAGGGVEGGAAVPLGAIPIVTRTIAHELLHALGFSSDLFEMQGMMGRAKLREKEDEVPVMTSSRVVEEAREQYGCPEQTFMELEDQGTPSTVGSHWKRRNAKDGLMSPADVAGNYTALTIAAMEDLGFYKSNYANAEPMTYGQNTGCSLTTSKCVVDGVSQFPSMFCADVNQPYTCTTDARAVGPCVLARYKNDLPPYLPLQRVHVQRSI